MIERLIVSAIAVSWLYTHLWPSIIAKWNETMEQDCFGHWSIKRSETLPKIEIDIPMPECKPAKEA